MDNKQMTPSLLTKLAESESIDPDKLEKLLELQFRYDAKNAEKAFQDALSGFQGECPIIKRTKNVDFTAKSGNKTKYDYSPLDEIIHIIKPILSKWGLAYSFNVIRGIDDNLNELRTKIYHKDGHSEEFSYFFNPMHDDQRMNQSQRAKSALTYAKRAGLENALGIVTAGEDDDARRAIDKPIDQGQIDTIEELIKTTKSDKTKFLATMKVSDLSELSDLEAKKGIHMLKTKRSK